MATMTHTCEACAQETTELVGDRCPACALQAAEAGLESRHAALRVLSAVVEDVVVHEGVHVDDVHATLNSQLNRLRGRTRDWYTLEDLCRQAGAASGLIRQEA